MNATFNLTVTKTLIPTIMRHDKQADTQNIQHVQAFRIAVYDFLFDIRYYFKISLTCSKFLIQTLRKMH